MPSQRSNDTTSLQSDWPKSGSMLTQEEHSEAAELIDELQDRWISLQTRGDEHIKRATLLGYSRPENFEPDTYEIQFNDDKTVIKVGQRGVSVLHNNVDVLRIYEGSITLIHLDKLSRAMDKVRSYMVLDDLAKI